MTWTPSEREQIAALQDKLTHLDDEVTTLRRALMEPSATGEAPLVEQFGVVTKAFNRADWLARAIVRTTLTLGALVGAIAAVWTAWKGGFPK